MFKHLFTILLLLFSLQVQAVSMIDTYAGGGPNALPALSANLDYPYGVVADNAGNIYVVSRNQHRVFKIDASGELTVAAGTGSAGFSGDGGPATSAQLNYPQGVAVDSAGNLYIADSNNNRIRRVDAATGLIETLAGTGIYGFSGDGGAATSAQLRSPFGVAVDSAGNLYIADRNNHRIRRVDTSGVIETLAGTGSAGFSGDGGPATSAQLNYPQGVAVDSAGNLYIADSNNNRIRRVDTGDVIETLAGNGLYGFSGDGNAATSARLNYPQGVAVDSAGNLYIADFRNHRIRRVDTGGVIETLAGNGNAGFSGDGGAATSARLYYPIGVAVDSAGNLYIADRHNHRIRRVDTGGVIETLAGNGLYGFSGDGNAATSARLNYPQGVAVDSAGNLYIADRNNHRIRRVDAATGQIETLAGNGLYGFSGDGGPATSARLAYPYGVAVDSAGNLYIADTYNHRIHRVDTSGVIETLAGTGSAGFSGDGDPATSARLYYPQGVAVDSAGNLYIADSSNNRIRRVDTNGVIETVAGNGLWGFSGDGGPATSARLYYPNDVAVDSAGTLYIADSNNNRIRRVDTNGVIATLAGNGLSGFSGDGGAATNARLYYPNDVAVDSAGTLYIADRYNHRIRRVDTNGVIETLAGNGLYGFSGDGSDATSAQLAYPYGVAVDSAGNLYIADTNNHRVRIVTQEVPANNPPVADAGSDQTVEANSASGRDDVTLDGSGTYDPDGDLLTFEWSGPFGTVSGATPVVEIPMGIHSILLTVDDGLASDTDNVVITVQDTTPPVLSVPANQTVEQDGPTGSVVNYPAGTASDAVDLSPVVSCTPASGSLFPAGATTVICSATDATGNSASATFLVTVVDTTPPVLSVPANQTVEQDGPTGSVVNYPAATASDAVDASPVVSCTPASGSLFPAGATTVICNATDATGNSANASFLVEVVDTTPPNITAPVDISTVATGPLTLVSLGSPVVYDASGSVSISNDASVAGYPVGITTVVTWTATDSSGNSATAIQNVTILNAAPIADGQALTTNEDEALAITLTGTDVDGFPTPLSFVVVTGPAHGSLSGIGASRTYAPAANYFGPDSITYQAYDGAAYSETATINITVLPVNDPPVLSVNLTSQTVQYSDAINTLTLIAEDIDDPAVSLDLAFSKNGGADLNGLPADLSTTANGCAAQGTYGASCSWSIDGDTMVEAGNYQLLATVSDDEGAEATASTEVVVEPELSRVLFDETNPVSVGVTEPGLDASVPFTITVHISEKQPDEPVNTAGEGDIALAQASMVLQPVGPGGSVAPDSCTESTSGSGYDKIKTVTCVFSAAPVNTYTVDVAVSGGYYIGGAEDVLTVYDPSLGFTTGGGWFYWPGTEDWGQGYPGDKTNFGYTMKYNKKGGKVQGSLLLIRHLPEDEKYRIKSNALEGLALGMDGSLPMGWATFSGKNTYLDPSMEDAEGNHEFTLYVEDRNDPGEGNDRVWLQARDKDGLVVFDMSLPESAADNAVEIQGGNIVAPH